MAKSYKPRRVHLKNHDAGLDRHQKGRAWEAKQVRLGLERHVNHQKKKRKGQP